MLKEAEAEVASLKEAGKAHEGDVARLQEISQACEARAAVGGEDAGGVMKSGDGRGMSAALIAASRSLAHAAQQLDSNTAAVPDRDESNAEIDAALQDAHDALQNVHHALQDAHNHMESLEGTDNTVKWQRASAEALKVSVNGYKLIAATMSC